MENNVIDRMVATLILNLEGLLEFSSNQIYLMLTCERLVI